MADILHDIWIMTNSGIVVFHKAYSKAMDSQLFGMLMTALNSFAEELSKGGLSSFELSDKRFCMTKQDNFLFVSSSDKKIKEKTVKKEMKFIINMFFSHFSKNILEHWDGDVSIFEEFAVEIEKIQKNVVDSFLRAI